MRYFFVASLGLLSLPLRAQTAAQVVMVDVQELIWFVFPFCLLTMLGLAFFIQRLMRPNSSSIPLYITASVGILWAILVANQLYKVEKEQIRPTNTNQAASNQNLSPAAQAQKDSIEAEHSARSFGNFYTIAAPNIIFLVLGLGLDWRRKKEKTI